MNIRKRLLVVGLVLFLVALSCIASAEGQSSESEEAYEKFQTCLTAAEEGGRSQITYLECVEPFNANELEALGNHDFCLASPDCLVAVQIALDENRGQATQTAEALPALGSVGEEDSLDHGSGECANLTLEECANAGSNWYTEVIASNRTDCAEPESLDEVFLTFTFEGAKVQNIIWIESSSPIPGYTGHTRIATNTYQYTFPDGFPINTLTFLQNGLVEEHVLSEVCTLTYIYTLVE